VDEQPVSGFWRGDYAKHWIKSWGNMGHSIYKAPHSWGLPATYKTKYAEMVRGHETEAKNLIQKRHGCRCTTQTRKVLHSIQERNLDPGLKEQIAAGVRANEVYA
jgi:hypothetical protein